MLRSLWPALVALSIAQPALAFPTTRSPKDAILVEAVGVPGSQALRAAYVRAVRGAAGAGIRDGSMVAFLKERGLVEDGWQPRLDRAVVLRKGNRLLLPAYQARQAPRRLTRSRQANSLAFRYVGWTTAEQAILQDYVNRAYPVLVSIYGAPSSSIQVSIVRDAELGDLFGGTYNPSTNEIRMPPIGDAVRDTFVLACLILRAFHDDMMFFYEVWETGFSRAAALVAHRQVEPSYDLASEPYYTLPLYELLNQPALGNSTVFPPSGYTAMSIWRVVMAQAAWLKVYAQYPGFFRDFNALYYAAFVPDRNPPLAGDISALVDIAEFVAPSVEGLAFADWYRRQHVLDTSVSIGEKLYLAGVPLYTEVALELDYYRTLRTGDEVPLEGTANLTYILWSGVSYLPHEGDQVPVTDGQGFLPPTFFSVGGSQRITIEASLAQKQARTYFPYMVRGPDNQNEVFGVTLGSDFGTFSVTLPGGWQGTAPVTRGAYGLDAGSPLATIGSSTMAYDSTTGGETRRVNTGYLHYAAVMQEAPGTASQVSHTFAAGLRMVAFPIEPFEADAAAALDVPPLELLLARWKADVTGQNRYVFYPHTPPLAPGLGFWLQLAQPLSVTIQGILPSRTASYPIRLLQGWNQAGNPFLQTVGLSKLRVKYLDRPEMSYDTAVRQGFVSPIYRLTDTGTYATTQQLLPWEGVWIEAAPAEGVWLIVAPP